MLFGTSFTRFYSLLAIFGVTSLDFLGVIQKLLCVTFVNFLGNRKITRDATATASYVCYRVSIVRTSTSRIGVCPLFKGKPTRHCTETDQTTWLLSWFFFEYRVAVGVGKNWLMVTSDPFLACGHFWPVFGLWSLLTRVWLVVTSDPFLASGHFWPVLGATLLLNYHGEKGQNTTKNDLTFS